MDAEKKNVATVEQKPRRLGRGLSSLLNISSPVEVHPPAPAPPAPTASQEIPNKLQTITGDGIRFVPVDTIEVSPFQPRHVIDEAALIRLADSIKRSGMLQPVLLRESSGGGGGSRGFELVAGERRWRAAKLAGLTMMPAIVRELSDEQAAEHALVENVQREDLNAMDRAWALRKLGERFGFSHADLAERVAMDRSSVANLIRLTELEPEISGMISAGQISAGHGKALLMVGAGESRLALARRVVKDDMSVRALEQLIQTSVSTIAVSKTVSKPGVTKDDARLAVLADLQRQIGQQLGTKVNIVTDRRGKKGRITLEFYGLDHFDSLMNRLGVKTT